MDTIEHYNPEVNEVMTRFWDNEFELDGIQYRRFVRGRSTYGGYFFNIRLGDAEAFDYHANCEVDEQRWLRDGEIVHGNNCRFYDCGPG